MNEEEWYVAYIDLLGVKESIKNDYEQLIADLNVAYSWTKSDMERHNNVDFAKHAITYKIFSDNIIIAVRCNDVVNSEILFKFLDLLGRFQSYLIIKKKILSRGAVVRGKITFQEDFVVGPALVTAYKIESECAVYPRIIVEDRVADEIEDKYENYKGIAWKDTDGLYFVFYFWEVRQYVMHKRQKIDEFINECIENTGISKENEAAYFKVAQKYNWLGSKLNDTYYYSDDDRYFYYY